MHHFCAFCLYFRPSIRPGHIATGLSIKGLTLDHFCVYFYFRPNVSPGHIDQGLSTKEPTLTPDPNNPGTYLSNLKLLGSTPGIHKACVQTGESSG